MAENGMCECCGGDCKMNNETVDFLREYFKDEQINENACGIINKYSPWGRIESDDITHWMPFPKPPENNGT